MANHLVFSNEWQRRLSSSCAALFSFCFCFFIFLLLLLLLLFQSFSTHTQTPLTHSFFVVKKGHVV